jgi:hypothetical protein
MSEQDPMMSAASTMRTMSMIGHSGGAAGGSVHGGDLEPLSIGVKMDPQIIDMLMQTGLLKIFPFLLHGIESGHKSLIEMLAHLGILGGGASLENLGILKFMGISGKNPFTIKRSGQGK